MRKLLIICILVLGVTSWSQASQHKVFVFPLNGHPDRLLDPAKCFTHQCQYVMWAIYESLGNLSADGRDVLPALARSWEVSPDGLTVTLHLRRGVAFHDGTPFNAEAARINLERYAKNSPKTNSLVEFTLAHLIKGLTVQNEQTLIVALQHPNAEVLFRVPMVSPTALTREGERYGKHPVGTGPFRFAGWTTDEIRLAANPEYWGGRPKLDQISFPIITDGIKKWRQFFAGHIHFLTNIHPYWMERIRDNPTTRVMRYPALNVCYMGIYADRGPFRLWRVREAIARAINIDQAILLLHRGRWIPAHSLVQPGQDLYNPDVKRPPYDRSEARSLLKREGYPPVRHFFLLRMSILYVSSSAFSQLAQAIKDDLDWLAVYVDLVGVPSRPKLVTEIQGHVGDAFIDCSHSNSPRPEDTVLLEFMRDNVFRYNNPKVRSLLNEAQRLRDPSARSAAYSEAHRIILEDAAIIPLWHMTRIAGYNARVTGLELNTRGLPVDRFLDVDIREE
ncbi:MAG: ABC transporter substrate-binding protein [Nitrospiraceae bacterium]